MTVTGDEDDTGYKISLLFSILLVRLFFFFFSFCPGSSVTNLLMTDKVRNLVSPVITPLRATRGKKTLLRFAWYGVHGI